MERGSRRRSSLEGRERAIAVNQTNIGTVLKATLGRLLRDGVERIIRGLFREHECIIMGFSKSINTVPWAFPRA